MTWCGVEWINEVVAKSVDVNNNKKKGYHFYRATVSSTTARLVCGRLTLWRPHNCNVVNVLLLLSLL